MPPPLALLLTALLVPLGTFLLLTSAGRRIGTTLCGILGTLSSLVSFSCALIALMHWLNGGVQGSAVWGAGHGVLRLTSTWTPLPAAGTVSPLQPISFGLHVDSLSIVIITAGLLASTAVHIFTTGYLRHDVRGPRIFALMALADASLVGLMTAASLPQWAVFSFLASISAYLMATPVPLGPGGLGITPVPRGLTGRDLTRRAAAALTLLLCRAVGDVSLLLASALLARPAPTLTWPALWAAGPDTVPPVAVALLLLAAVAHAAAFPVAVFLPDARGLPTPSAALTYGITLLPSGVLLLARVFPLLSATHLTLLGVVGSATLAFACLGALTDSDLRRWLAWLVVGSVGATFSALSAGSLGGAVLHVVACMFGVPILVLAAGSVLHACLGERRLSHYGGLLFRMPATALLLAHGVGTILGGPLLAGSGSWNTLLTHAYRSSQAAEPRGYLALASLGLSLFLLSVAAGRGWSLLFLGRPRDRVVYAPARESATLSVPVAILALVATVAGHPVLSPVRQFVLNLTPEYTSTLDPSDPTPQSPPQSAIRNPQSAIAPQSQIATPQIANLLPLSRDIPPPEARPEPAPEDYEAREARDAAPLPPDDKIPRLIDPIRWTVSALGLFLGLALPRLLKHASSTTTALRHAAARGFHLSRHLTAAALAAIALASLAAQALETFLFTPAATALSRLVLPFARRPRPLRLGPDSAHLPTDPASNSVAPLGALSLLTLSATLMAAAAFAAWYIRGGGGAT